MTQPPKQGTGTISILVDCPIQIVAQAVVCLRCFQARFLVPFLLPTFANLLLPPRSINRVVVLRPGMCLRP